MKIIFIDTEITAQRKIANIWAIDQHWNLVYSWKNVEDFFNTTKDYDVLAWHNIIHHDLNYLWNENKNILPNSFLEKPVIDTLWLSSLIFIRKPYHKLIKSYKKNLNPDEEDELDNFFLRHQPDSDVDKWIENNPIKDSEYSLQVFENCVEEFQNIAPRMQEILYALLKDTKEFSTFFKYLIDNKLFSGKKINLEKEIHWILKWVLNEEFFSEVLPELLKSDKNWILAFTYILRLIEQNLNRDKTLNPDCSILPFWILHKLWNINSVFSKIFKYKKFNAVDELKNWDWINNYKEYKFSFNENWKNITEVIKQEDIVNAWFNWEDFITILATWWGKSLCFQVPALAKAEFSWFLTLVISPLQSLMEDQVDNLKKRFYKTNVWALHSWLDPLTKKEVCEKIENWWIDLLYLSPEMLRSPSTQKLLEKRHIDRLVIDEAHCFSKWWHDFRIDYMFIADFIKELGKKNKSIKDISISCFTATAKQEVIAEIKHYFKQHFKKDLKEFKSRSVRDNLHYEAYEINPKSDKKWDEEKKKFDTLIDIIEKRVGKQACIIFTRLTWQKKNIWAENLAESINERLLQDWYWDIKAAYFHGQLDWKKKSDMMNSFMNNETNVIVATNAFWMWVDKPDVRFVIHYDMPSSLENYLQEAGRAWRDWKDSACIILHSPNDLDANLQLNQTSQLKKSELEKLLKYIKKQFQLKWKNKIINSAREFVKYSWWISWNFDEEYEDKKKTLETKVKTALWFLQKPFPDTDEPRFIERKFNKTRVFATAKWKKIFKNSFQEVENDDLSSIFERIDNISSFDEEEREKAKEIYRYIRTWKVISIEDLPNKIWWHIRRKRWAKDSDGNPTKECKHWIEEIVDTLRDNKLVDKEDSITLSFNITWKESSEKRIDNVREFISVIFNLFNEENHWYINEWTPINFSKKELNTKITQIIGNTNNIDMIEHFFYIIKNRWYANIQGDELLTYLPFPEIRKILDSEFEKWAELIKMILEQNVSKNQKAKEWIMVEDKLKRMANELSQKVNEDITVIQLENILKLLHEFDVIWVESWLFLYRTRFEITRWKHLVVENEDWSTKYANLKEEHYESLKDFYINKTQQAHIMDEFAKKIIEKLPLWKERILDIVIDENGKEIFIEKEISHADRFANEMTDDYFNLDYENEFLPKYFSWRISTICRSTSEKKHKEIWDVSDEQKSILNSKKNLLVVAWPWSWKTKSIVHKVASLVREEWVWNDEFLLLTFMRSAKFELKDRIIKLVWTQGYKLKIHTFHWFAYELLQKNPLKWEYNDDENDKKKEKKNKIIKDAIAYLEEHKDIQLPYRVIMIDEFQDIWEIHFKFIEAISKRSQYNENKIRIIATWDDDQSIMDFEGADADIKYIQNFKEEHNAESVILSKNFRSTQELVEVSNNFASSIRERLKKWTELTSWRKKDISNISKIEARNYTWNYLYWTIDALKEIKSNNKFETTAIICSENETVLQINHLLKKKWYNPQVLMWNDWYKLRDALELRYFLDLCTDENWEKLTKDNIWDKYKAVISKFWENKNTELIEKIINKILETNSYVTSQIVKDFMIDIKDEADIIGNNHQLYVSTIHKAKWREFDNVIFCFDPDKASWWNKNINNIKERDKIKRLIYVWITRAKNNLIILWNKDDNAYFNFFYSDRENKFWNIIKRDKTYSWEEVNEISIITWLWHTRMSFNWDKNFWPLIWEEVEYSDWKNSKWEPILIYKSWNDVIQKSSGSLVPYLEKWIKKWYKIESIKVNQKILHCPKNDTKDHLIFLFDILLKKSPKEFKEIAEANEKVKILEEKIQELSESWTNDAEYQKAITERDKQIKILEEKASILKDKLSIAEKNIKERESSINENKQKIDDLQKIIDSLSKEKENAEYNITIIEGNLKQAIAKWNKEIYDEYESKLKEAEENLAYAESKLILVWQEKTILEWKNQQLKEENDNLKTENKELSRKIIEAQNHVSEWNKGLVFKAWEWEKIKEYLIKQINSANKSVIIIDPYIDEITFKLLWNRKIWVKWEIRYDKTKMLRGWSNNYTISELLKKKWDQEWNPIIVRDIHNLHDRFLIIDDTVWSIGTSMNSTLWKKVTTIQKLKNNRQEILEAYR